MELKELCIKSLLSDKLVIPEIQREYVWGSNETVLKKFLTELNENLSVDTNIGFLYSYNAENTEHYIIDGQQRLTTIILLLYYYSVKEGKRAEFKDLLQCSESCMRFSYRVRSLTEHFLLNLFQDEKIRKESFCKLHNLKWYISDYDSDATINSICKLYAWLSKNEEKYKNFNYNSLLVRVRFYYFDVQQTAQGEELYITMNSRGEPLKDNEQIKPYILKKVDDKRSCAKKWDEWEEYFFGELPSKDESNVCKVDIAIENIIKITLELYGKRKVKSVPDEEEKWEFNEINATIDSQRIDFTDIEKVFNSIKSIIESTNDRIKSLDFKNFIFSTERTEKKLFALEALIRMLHVEYSLEDKDLQRILRLIHNACEYGVTKHKPLLKFLSGLEKTENLYKDILGSDEKDTSKIKGVFISDDNKEELEKIKAILAKGISEDEIEAVESLPIFNGQIHLLYRDATTAEISWKDFSQKVEKAKDLFSENKNEIIKDGHEQFVDFVFAFIKSFDNLEQLRETYLFNNKYYSEWHAYLTDYKYLKPISNILLDIDIGETTHSNKFDENTKSIYNFFANKVNIKKITEEIQNGRFRWLYWGRNCFHQNYENYIVFDWDNFKRNQYLNKLLDENRITIDESIRIGDFFIGANIDFTYNDKTYTWTWYDEIKCNSDVVVEAPINEAKINNFFKILQV
ncbi:MAG: DUF262 domain-containing protein [Treponema sp.]|nr:DUF262 domain-containing protein [Treponema sp.]